MNVVFFIPDELRAESVGCIGLDGRCHLVARTPSIARLAREGVHFDQTSPGVS